jgi:flagellar protein FliO/FliZ
MDSAFGTALSGLLGTLVALAIVLGIAWLGFKALRQWQDGQLGRKAGQADHQLRFIRALPVGQRERVMLIEAKGELMLIGVSTGSVRLLRSWGSGAGTADPRPEDDEVAR